MQQIKNMSPEWQIVCQVQRVLHGTRADASEARTARGATAACWETAGVVGIDTGGARSEVATRNSVAKGSARATSTRADIGAEGTAGSWRENGARSGGEITAKETPFNVATWAAR